MVILQTMLWWVKSFSASHFALKDELSYRIFVVSLNSISEFEKNTSASALSQFKIRLYGSTWLILHLHLNPTVCKNERPCPFVFSGDVDTSLSFFCCFFLQWVILLRSQTLFGNTHSFRWEPDIYLSLSLFCWTPIRWFVFINRVSVVDFFLHYFCSTVAQNRVTPFPNYDHGHIYNESQHDYVSRPEKTFTVPFA